MSSHHHHHHHQQQQHPNEVELKESKKIVLCICCSSDKNWEGKNVKFPINYRYNSNLYALFTCFVFRYYGPPFHFQMDTHQIPCISPSTYTISRVFFPTERFVYVARSFHIHSSFSLQLSPCDFSICFFFYPLPVVHRTAPPHDLHHFLLSIYASHFLCCCRCCFWIS